MSFERELQEAKQKIEKIIEKRKQALVKIITSADSLNIDDNVLFNILLFLKNPDNKEHPFIKEITTTNKKNSKQIPSPYSKEVETA